MEQIQYQSYEDGTQYKPGYTPDLLPAMEQEARRQSQADEAALVQLQQNNRQRVENSKLAGRDMLELSKFSATIAKEVGAMYKRNEDEKAVNEVYDSIVNGVPEDIALVETEQIQQASQQNEEVNAAATAVEAETGDVAAGEAIRQDFGGVGQAQVASRASLISARAEYPSFIQSWIESDARITVNGEEMTVAQAVATGDPRIIQSVVALGRNKFIRERGIQGAKKLEVNRILGTTILQTDGKVTATAVRTAIGERKKQELEDLSASTYNLTASMTDGTEQDTFSTLALQYWESGLFTTRADANKAVITNMLSQMTDAGDVESIEALRDVLKTGEKGTELKKQYGDQLNDALRAARQNRDGITRQEVQDVQANMYAELNGAQSPAERAAIVEKAAEQLEDLGRFQEARQLRSQQQQMTVEGSSQRNAAVMSDQIKAGEIVSAKPIEEAYLRGELSQAQRDTLITQLATKQSTQAPNSETGKSMSRDYTARFESDFLPLAGLKLDQFGNPVDAKIGERPLISAGEARVIKGAVQRDLNIALNAALSANPVLGVIEQNQLLQKTANEWYQQNVLTKGGKYYLGDLQDASDSGNWGAGKYPKEQMKYWNNLINSPELLATPQGFSMDSAPRDFTKTSVSSITRSEFNPVRGDRLFAPDALESYVDTYKENGSFPQGLIDASETIGMSPLALLQQQLGAYGMEPVVPNTSGSGVDISSAEQGARVLMTKGFPARGAAFLSGNIAQESSWNGQRYWGEVLNDGSDRNGGLVSWMDDADKNHFRLRRIEERLGTPINQATDEQQIDAMIWEMKTYYPEAYSIFTNPYATERQLMDASRQYWGYGKEGSRYTTARQVQSQIS